MGQWYVYDDGTQKGPFEVDELAVYVTSKDPARVHVWRSGFEGWVLARDVAEFGFAERPQSPRARLRDSELRAERRVVEGERGHARHKFRWARNGALIGAAICALDVLEWRGPQYQRWDTELGLSFNAGYIAVAVGLTTIIGFVAGAIRDLKTFSAERETVAGPEQPRRAHRFNNVIARHWRGELPLWVSYWVFGFLGNLTIRVLSPAAMAAFKVANNYDPYRIFAVASVALAGSVLVTIWQLVGVWRSATRYSDIRDRMDKISAYGSLAKLSVVLGFIGSIGSVAQELPQMHEMYRIAFEDDPAIPNYSIRVMRNGTEAEIVGGFKYGLTDDFVKVLNASKQIKVIHLDSVGGRLGEGEKLFNLIRDRGLTTYVSSKCMSACTLAFAGGRERYILKDAALGFHRGAFPGVREDAFDSIQRDIFKLAGFDNAFINTAVSTPNRNMWQPSAKVLLEAKVITGVTDGTRFSASGYGADLTRDETAAMLSEVLPSLRSMKTLFPERFDAIVDDYYQSILEGRTQAATTETLRARLIPFMQDLVPLADDDVLIDFNGLLVDQYLTLKPYPSRCWAYASGEHGSRDQAPAFPTALVRRELDLQKRVIETAAKRSAADSSVVVALWDKVRKGLIAKGTTSKQLALLDSEKLDVSKYADYCVVSIRFFQEIGRLPRREAALLMRQIFANRFSPAR
jgi:hypothetical protein